MSKESKLLTNYIKQKQLRELQELMPQVFDGDKLNFNKLKVCLGTDCYSDENNYGLNWFNKQLCVDTNEDIELGKFILDKEKSLGLNNSNFLIEGDNLSVIKLLKKNYCGKIKLIYFDPPYNTGKQFAFNDNYQISSSRYLDYLNELNPVRVDTFTKNRIESGEKHTQWLNMIYPRLIHARDLLTKDGLILFSIDESEKSNLQIICNEVLGEVNFVGSFIWINRSIPNDSSNFFATTHEYILVYAKNKELIKFKGEEKDLSLYTNPDCDCNGDWIADNPTAASGNKNSRFPIKNPFTGEEYFPPSGRCWAFSKNRVEKWTKSGKLVFPKEVGKRFLLKKYKSELKSRRKPISSIITDIPTSKGTKELKSLYPEGLPFKYPKPTDLLVKIFGQLSNDKDIILDLFAGSASTAHAIFKLNEKENTKRNFICVQNNEPTIEGSDAYAMGFRRLCDLSRDRIIRSGKLYSEVKSGFNYLKVEFEK